jgi:opacity protein-like surface antigen
LEGTVNDKDGFSWGLGASYAFMDNLSVFADYVSLYDDDALNENGYGEDMTIETWNFGLTYKF